MRKLLLLALTALCALLVPMATFGQGALPPYWVRAAEFNQWSFTSQAANTYTFAGTNCFIYPQVQGQLYPGSFFAFGPNSAPYPVFIQDQGSSVSNNEIVTPTSVSTVSGACGFSASTANQHTSFYVKSGTAGLQEAVGTLGSTSTPAQPWTVIVDRTTYQQVAGLPGTKTVGSIIAALKGSVNVNVVDITTAPWTYYAWNGSAYFSNGGGTPVVAAAAGLGTGPTGLIISGNGAGGTVSVTTGTGTATGNLFTMTYPSGTTSTGFNHSPTCTFAGVGANAIAGTLGASVSGSAASGYVVTATITTTALTASTFYSMSYSCK